VKERSDFELKMGDNSSSQGLHSLQASIWQESLTRGII